MEKMEKARAFYVFIKNEIMFKNKGIGQKCLKGMVQA
jgi:hypothetical protein